MAELQLEYCGDVLPVSPTVPFTIGRSGHLAVDDNPYLHRTFLELRHESGVWLVANVGRHLAATVGDVDGHFNAHLAPGGMLPLVFPESFLRFSAGATTYEVRLLLSDAPFAAAPAEPLDEGGTTTRGLVSLTADQRLLVLALAEHVLRRTATGPSVLPTTVEAAARLGWPEKRFNKKLDALCQKLARAGVPGLHGGPGDLASNRRARLVEHCISARIVTGADLVLLDSVMSAAD